MLHLKKGKLGKLAKPQYEVEKAFLYNLKG